MSETLQPTETSAPVRVPVGGMKPIGVRPNILSYIRELWTLRFFIHEQARGKALSKSRGTILGRLWIVMEPFFNASVYIIMFGMVLHIDRGIPNFIGYVFMGGICFGFCRKALGTAGGIMSGSHALMKSFAFPRATIVLAHVMVMTLNVLTTYAIMLVGVLFLGDGARPSIHWLLFPVAVVLQIMFNLGISFLLAAITAKIPDLKYVWHLLSNFWWFASGIFFNVARFIRHPILAAIMDANPGYVLLKLMRDAVLYNKANSPLMWGYMTVWAVGLLTFGFIVFWRGEETYGAKNER